MTSRPRVDIEALGIDVPTGVVAIAMALCCELRYDELVEFVMVIEDQMRDSMFTDMLKARLYEL